MINEDTRAPVPKDTREGSDLPQRKGQSAFQNIDRELSEDDLINPAVAKLLLGEKDRLEIENAELRNYQEKFYETDKMVAVLKEKSQTNLATEIISVVLFTVGAAMLGYAPALWESQPSGWIALVLGAVLIIGGIFAKAVKR